MIYEEFINPQENDIYDYEYVIESAEDDEINTFEEAFMLGYFEAA